MVWELKPLPIYTGEEPVAENDYVHTPTGEVARPIRFKVQKPDDGTGKERDQTGDAALHMRYAATLNLPNLKRRQLPRVGRAIIVGGAPSIKDHLEEIRELAKDPLNAVFAVNWSHTWLIERGVIPKACVFFEIDAEPDTVLKAAHKDVTYFICCHCHNKTFDMLNGYKRVLWHTPPNSEAEKQVHEELFADVDMCGGGVGTFTRTMSVALFLGFRHFDLFGCDSSFPENGGTHVKGYETPMDEKTDSIYVQAKDEKSGEVRQFKTLGYLALQMEEFKHYCLMNHNHYSLRVYGDSLLRFTHEHMWPDQYSNELVFEE